jgi:hypothetical protein
MKAILVSRCEEERRTALKGPRNVCNRPNGILGIQMEHNAPGNGSIEHTIGERAGLNNSSDSKRFRAVPLKL